jgi:hypothetical protein
MFRLVTLVRTYVSEEHIASIIRVKRISELRILRSVRQLLVTANVVPVCLIISTLMIEAIRSSRSSVLNKSHTPSHPRKQYSS